jgi:drug/metabolite transporter (DMT)-like permease
MRKMKTFDAGASRRGFTVVNPVVKKTHSRASRKYAFVIIMLTLATVFWGFGNVAQKIALNDLSPIMLLFIRSAVAVICLVPFAVDECIQSRIPFKKIWQNRGLLFLTSASFAIGLSLQTFGGQYTSATNLGFLINLCVLITPLLLFVFFRERVSRLTLVSCLICFCGAGLLTGLHFQAPSMGDAMCLAGAVAYAVWIIALDRTLKVVDLPILITLLQFLPLSCASWVFASPHGEVFALNYSKLWPALIFVSVLSTCLSFLIASYAQRLVNPVIAALIYSFEALFGALGAYVVLGEQLSLAAMVGGALMFGSIILCQIHTGLNQNQNQRPMPMPHRPRKRMARPKLAA